MIRSNFLRHLRHRAGHLACSNPLYDWSLAGAVPESMVCALPDNWPGSAENGRWLCDGAFSMEEAQLPMRGSVWQPEGVSAQWLEHMHGFSWLRDLRAVGGDDARRQAAEMILHWIRHYPRWHATSWRPDLAGERVANWIALYEFYRPSLNDESETEIFDSLMRQARHIARALPGELAGVALLRAIRGLASAGIAFSGREVWLMQALDMLQEEIECQILPDGGHISRSPQQLIEALRLIIDIRAALMAGGYPVPEQITHTIDRMAQAVRFFRYADKGFALFNGMQEGDETLIDAILFKANAKGRVLRNLPHSLYERATLGRSVVMMDAGAPAPWPFDQDAHAAPLSFEFTYGKERIFVACGTHPLDPDWREALRATSAHNTLCLDHRNAVEIREDGHIGRRPRSVTIVREDSRDAVLLEGSHDGYIPINGITHRRRLYLLDQGHDLRGEETLTCSVGISKPVEIAVRFHIHPKVQVSLIQDGQEALLRLAGGAGWRFFHTGGQLALEDSLYLGHGTKPRKSKQLVLSGTMDTDVTQIKWALQREGV